MAKRETDTEQVLPTEQEACKQERLLKKEELALEREGRKRERAKAKAQKFRRLPFYGVAVDEGTGQLAIVPQSGSFPHGRPHVWIEEDDSGLRFETDGRDERLIEAAIRKNDEIRVHFRPSKKKSKPPKPPRLSASEVRLLETRAINKHVLHYAGDAQLLIPKDPQAPCVVFTRMGKPRPSGRG